MVERLGGRAVRRGQRQLTDLRFNEKGGWKLEKDAGAVNLGKGKNANCLK